MLNVSCRSDEPLAEKECSALPNKSQVNLAEKILNVTDKKLAPPGPKVLAKGPGRIRGAMTEMMTLGKLMTVTTRRGPRGKYETRDSVWINWNQVVK
jgi:hypothetical protein